MKKTIEKIIQDLLMENGKWSKKALISLICLIFALAYAWKKTNDPEVALYFLLSALGAEVLKLFIQSRAGIGPFREEIPPEPVNPEIVNRPTHEIG